MMRPVWQFFRFAQSTFDIRIPERAQYFANWYARGSTDFLSLKIRGLGLSKKKNKEYTPRVLDQMAKLIIDVKLLAAAVPLRRSRVFGQVQGRNKLKAGSRLLVLPFPEINHPVLLRGAVKLVGSRRPVGKMGETRSVFPGLSIGDRACAVRRGSADRRSRLSTKFTAPPRHGVRRPVPW
jgi:hypothetical protein